MEVQTKLYLGEHKSGKTSSLTDFFIDSVDEGVLSSEIIFIVRNKTLEQQLKEAIRERLNSPVEQINIFGFRSFVYNIISAYWPYLYNYPPAILGFSESITVMRYFLSANPHFFEEAYLDKVLLTKLFERQQRRVENGLSFADLKIRTERLEHNGIVEKANIFLEAYHNWLTKREKPIFDYSAQLDCFWQLTEISEVKHLITKRFNFAWLIDDIDEAIPLEHKFYEKIAGNVKNLIYTGNQYGGMRRFMGSDPDYIFDLKEKVRQTVMLVREKISREKSLFRLGVSIYNILDGKTNEYQIFNADKSEKFELISSVSYSRMLEQLKAILKDLHNKKIKPEEITIVCWDINEPLQLEIESQIKDFNWELETIKGSQLLFRNPLINVIITLLRIIYFEEIKEDKRFEPLTSFDFSQLLYIIGNTDNYYLAKLRRHLKNEPENWFRFIREYAVKEGFKTVKVLNEALNYCIKEKHNIQDPEGYKKMVLYLWKKLFWNSEYFKQRKGFNELKIFLQMLGKYIEIGGYLLNRQPVLEFINQLLNGELSDNPDRAINLKSAKIKLLTMQKLSEIKHSSPIQIWLDITADRWLKNDHHALINPNLLSERWPLDKPWSLIAEEDLTEQKLARSLRLSFSLCEEKAYFLSTEYNVTGELQTYDFIKSFLKSSKQSVPV